jgi:hypothetical protein
VAGDATEQSANITDDGVEITTQTVEPAANDIWLKFGKNWGDVRGDTDYHSTAVYWNWAANIYMTCRQGKTKHGMYGLM